MAKITRGVPVSRKHGWSLFLYTRSGVEMVDRMCDMLPELVKMLLAGDDPVLACLRNQMRDVRLGAAQMTGHGFFVSCNLSVAAIPIPNGPSFAFGDVVAEIEGLKRGAGFVFFVKYGLARMIEGYSFEEPWPPIVSEFRLKYNPGIVRDLRALRKTPHWPLE